jgi:hypothetical protein
MTSLPAAKQTKRFYPSTCPVCGEPALEAYITAQKIEFECGRCGGYGITVAAKSMMNRRSQQQRKAWLTQAREQASSNTLFALVDRANEPQA